MDCNILGVHVLHHLLELAQTHVDQVSDAIQPSHPLSSPSPPAFNVSQHQGLFQWVCSLHQVAKVLELQHQSFQWIFRIGWLDLLAVQGNLKNLLQHHRLKASVLQRSAFFMVQLSHSYMTTGKTIALAAKTGCDSLPPPPCHWTTHALGAWNTACPMAALYRNSPYFWVVDVFSPKSFKQHQIFYKSLSWNIAEA